MRRLASCDVLTEYFPEPAATIGPAEFSELRHNHIGTLEWKSD